MGRSGSSGNERRNATRRPSGETRGLESRTGPAVSCRRGTAARRGEVAPREGHEQEVGAVRLAVDEAPDHDRAAPVGEGIVLLENDLAADQGGGVDLSGHACRVVREA